MLGSKREAMEQVIPNRYSCKYSRAISPRTSRSNTIKKPAGMNLSSLDRPRSRFLKDSSQDATEYKSSRASEIFKKHESLGNYFRLPPNLSVDVSCSLLRSPRSPSISQKMRAKLSQKMPADPQEENFCSPRSTLFYDPGSPCSSVSSPSSSEPRHSDASKNWLNPFSFSSCKSELYQDNKLWRRNVCHSRNSALKNTSPKSSSKSGSYEKISEKSSSREDSSCSSFRATLLELSSRVEMRGNQGSMRMFMEFLMDDSSDNEENSKDCQGNGENQEQDEDEDEENYFENAKETYSGMLIPRSEELGYGRNSCSSPSLPSALKNGEKPRKSVTKRVHFVDEDPEADQASPCSGSKEVFCARSVNSMLARQNSRRLAKVASIDDYEMPSSKAACLDSLIQSSQPKHQNNFEAGSPSQGRGNKDLSELFMHIIRADAEFTKQHRKSSCMPMFR